MTDQPISQQVYDPEAPTGSAWAALLAAAIGAAAFGLFTDISENSATVARYLQWYKPAGSLSGVTISAIIIWLAAWFALNGRWHYKNIRHQKTLLTLTIFLGIAAIVATFPPFYELFGG